VLVGGVVAVIVVLRMKRKACFAESRQRNDSVRSIKIKDFS
jgi:hypothetical protein